MDLKYHNIPSSTLLFQPHSVSENNMKFGGGGRAGACGAGPTGWTQGWATWGEMVWLS